jgi:hypothetical protein
VVGLRRLPGTWSALSEPDVVATPDGGARLVVGAEPGGSSAAVAGVVTAVEAAGATSWVFADAPLAAAPGLGASQLGAASLRDGTTVVAWTKDGALRYRFATSGSSVVAVPDCCARAPDVAVDGATSGVVVAWISTGPSGGVVARTSTAARPVGRRLYAPGSAGRSRKAFLADDTSRVAVSGRIGAPGVYVAYGRVAAVASPRRFVGIRLWRVGSSGPSVDLRSPDVRDVTLAASAGGRLWLAWQRGGRLYATRTNRAVTRVGAVRMLPAPPRSRGVARVQGEGSAGPLDLVVDAAGPGGFTAWHARVLPGLSLGAVATREAGGLVRYSFRVVDAGDPVPNATVRVGKQTLTTGATGAVVLETADVPRSATASKPGYAPATTTLRAP